MPLIAAIRAQLLADATLVALAPADRIFTGLAPVSDASAVTITPPYVTVLSEKSELVSRSSSGTRVMRDAIRFTAYSTGYEQARAIAQRIADMLGGAQFAWDRGQVLDIRAIERVESEDAADGVWRIAQDMQFLYTDTGGE